MSDRIKAVQVVTSGRKFIWIAGFYHSKTLKKHFLYNVVRAFCLTVFYLFPVLILLFLIVEKPNITIILDEAIYFTGSLWFSAKISLHINNLPKLLMLEDLLEADVLNIHTHHQNHFMYTAKTMTMYVLRGYWCAYCTAAIAFVLCPIVTKYSLTAPIWTPFAGENEHIFVYFYESIFMIVASYTYPTIDYTSIGLILMAIAQVEILKDNLKHSTDRDTNEDHFTQEKKIQARLRSCVIHHNAILDFVAKIQDLLSPFFFWQVFFTGIELCMIAVQIFVAINNSQAVIMMLIFIGIIGQISVMCWCGQQLINQSSTITEACYMTEWYACSVSTRKLLRIIMTNSEAPIVLYAGKLFTISYDTLVNIIRNAYSYYIVFMQVYQD